VFKKLRDKLVVAINNAKIKVIGKYMEKSGYSLSEIDQDEYAFLVDLGDPICTLVSLDETTKSLMLESTLVLEPHILNLKTFSAMAHVCMSNGLGMSGVVPGSNGTVKVYIGKTISDKSMKRLPYEMEQVRTCITQIIGYINYRSGQNELLSLDLSMFEEIDVNNFNPQVFGEKKDFIYRTWQNYANAVVSSSANLSEASDTINKINACAEFERLNDLSLSEVGDIVLEELVWNRGFVSTAEEDDYQIN